MVLGVTLGLQGIVVMLNDGPFSRQECHTWTGTGMQSDLVYTFSYVLLLGLRIRV